LPAWLADELREGYAVPLKLAQTMVESDMVLPLLDGLDELPPKYRAACVNEINNYRDEHGLFGLLPIAVASRLKEYEDLGIKLRMSAVIEIEPLGTNEIMDFINRIGAPALQTAIIENPVLLRSLSSPLLLQVLKQAYSLEASRTKEASEWIPSGPEKPEIRDEEQALATALDLAEALTKLGNLESARTFYERVIQASHPDLSPLAAARLGMLLASEGDNYAAQRAFQQAIDASRAAHTRVDYKDALTDLTGLERRILRVLDESISQDEVQVASAALVAPGQAEKTLARLREKGLVEVVTAAEGQSRYFRAAGVTLG